MDSSSTCPFCHLSLPSSQLQWHANTHFDDDEDHNNHQLATDHEFAQQLALSLASEQAVSGLHFDETCGDYNIWCGSGGGPGRNNGEWKLDEKISCLIELQRRSEFHKVEAGLMALLRNCLESESENSRTILSGYIDHFQSIESEDVGWGCGWRNIQILSSHLLAQRPEARGVLFGGSGFVPDIPSLQRWLEIAWERGFDAPGSDQFNHAIYGMKKWIGTTECAALLRSFGLRARIVDFGPKESQSFYLSLDDTVYKEIGGQRVVNSNTNKTEGHLVLMDFVWNYFSNKSSIQFGHRRVIISDKTPLYFQHDGHSRTIVGIQVKHQRSGILQYTLLVLDPAHGTAALERSLREKVGWQKLIKRGIHTLKKPQYQLCYVDPGIASEDEMEKLKTIDSVFLDF
ncbi:hypothetical protein RIF29_17040 [Crotalaria pallida]|uniref:UFSP1/2/DUB catalytic domain-containing protein n=1 Tax=Crotalaria pallida TaxID=3830 RepID=A0AAN9FHQ3_CROPI